jgi:hypothetical protein
MYSLTEMNLLIRQRRRVIMKTLPGIRIAAVTIVFLSCLFLSSGCSSLVSSTQIELAAIKTPTPSTAYYFLPLVKIHLIAERKKWDAECTSTISEVLTEADPRYMFTLWHEPNVFADDEVTITLGPNGLLGKVETTSEGKAGQVVLKLTELAEAVMKASAGVPTVRQPGKVAPFRYEAILDPDANEEVETFNNVLKTSYQCNIALKVDPPPIRLCRRGNGKGPCIGKVGEDPIVEKRDGIFYRPALPYKIALKPVGDTGILV